MEEQDPLAAALKSLAPAAAKIDPVAAAFAAGRKTGARRAHVWQAATALSLALCAAAWVWPASQPPEKQSVTVAAHVAERPPGPVSEQSILYLQEVVLRRGVDGMPRPDVASAGRVNVQELY
jgi:hypothetical protein